MYSRKICIYAAFFIFCASCLIPGCKQDKEETAYKGVGRLVAERHRARLAQSTGKKKHTSQKNYIRKSTPVLNDQSSPEETISEKKVKIVSSSGSILARATAFLDGNGKIISIKIEQE